MIKKMTCIICCIIMLNGIASSQGMDLAAYYGRFWSPYRHIDYGHGYLSQSRSNYNFFPSVYINKYYSRRLSAELGLMLTIYEQYYSTRKYTPAFESSFIAGHIAVRAGYSLVAGKKWECRVKGGISIGIMGYYETEYGELLIYPVMDSISRGFIKRNFTPVFPMLGTGIDISYKIAKRFKLSLAANYQKGFMRITQYDIYYNDGNGRNDQRAMQWGAGDFYGVQLGVRYGLREKNLTQKR